MLSLTDDRLTESELHERVAFQAEAIATHIGVSVSSAIAFLPDWNLTGRSRGGGPAAEITRNPGDLSAFAQRVRAFALEGADLSPSAYDTYVEYCSLAPTLEVTDAIDATLSELAWGGDIVTATGIAQLERWAYSIPWLTEQEENAGVFGVPFVVAFHVEYPVARNRTVDLSDAICSEIRHAVDECAPFEGFSVVASTGVFVQPGVGTDLPTSMLREIFMTADKLSTSLGEYEEGASEGFVLVGGIFKMKESVARPSTDAASLFEWGTPYCSITLPELSYSPMRIEKAGRALDVLVACTIPDDAEDAVDLDILLDQAAIDESTVTLRKVPVRVPLIADSYDIRVEPHAGHLKPIVITAGHRPLRTLAWLIGKIVARGVPLILVDSSMRSVPASELSPNRAKWFVRELSTEYPAEDLDLQLMRQSPGWQSLCAKSPFAVSAIHEECLRTAQNIGNCTKYADFLASYFAYAAPTDDYYEGREVFAIVVQGTIKTMPPFAQISEQVRAHISESLQAKYKFQNQVVVAPKVLLSPFGASLMTESIFNQAWRSLNGAVGDRPLKRSARRTVKEPMPGHLVVLFAVSGADATHLSEALEQDFQAEMTVDTEFFISEKDRPVDVGHPHDTLVGVGLQDVDGDDMTAHLFSQDVSEISLRIEKVAQAAESNLFVCSCDAKLKHGGTMSGVVETLMPAIYVGMLNALAEQCEAPFSVNYME